MQKKQLEVTDSKWLDSLKHSRHLTERSMQEVGIPARYNNLKDRSERCDPFINRFLYSDTIDTAKNVLTDYILRAMYRKVPGVSIKAVGFSELCDALVDYRNKEMKDIYYKVDSLFIYDFGFFFLKDFQKAAFMTLYAHRHNNNKHMSMAVGGIPKNSLTKNLGTMIFTVVSKEFICEECTDEQ